MPGWIGHPPKLIHPTFGSCALSAFSSLDIAWLGAGFDAQDNKLGCHLVIWNARFTKGIIQPVEAAVCIMVFFSKVGIER